MSEIQTAVEAVEPIVLNEGQQEAYDQIMEWLRVRSDDPKGDLRFKKPKFQLPPGAEKYFKDNPDDYFVLKGFAGSGKSTLVSQLIVDLSAEGWNMIACAPTNKAVGVIQDKVREAAGSRVLCATFKSLHSVCGLRMAETDDGDHVVVDSGFAEMDQYQLAIVDEASMIDTPQLLRSIQNSRGRCLVLIVGDPAQLPPIIENSVAKVFKLPQGNMLMKITRQAEGNPLIAASMKIRAKNLSDQLLDEGFDELIAGMGAADRVQASELMEWMPESMVKGSRNLVNMCVDYQRQGIDARIVSYHNTQVLNHNQTIHYELYPESGRVLFSAGERVIVQNACKAESLDTGKTVDLVTSEELVIEYVERDEHPNYPGVKCYMLIMKDDLGNSVKVYTPTLMTGFKNRCSELFGEVNEANHRLKKGWSQQQADKLKYARGAAWGFKNAFAEIRHTYAITAHKAQGSGFPICLVDYPDLMAMQTAFLFNCALYVAVTRATKKVFIAY